MSDFPIVSTGDNVTRQVLSDHPDLMVVAFRFAAEGAVGALHDHPHVQSTYVESGRFRFTLGEEWPRRQPCRALRPDPRMCVSGTRYARGLFYPTP